MTQRSTLSWSMKSIKYKSLASKSWESVRPGDVIDVVVQSNKYLENVSREFGALGIELYRELQQRNLSGFVGEVFSRFFSSQSHPVPAKSACRRAP